MTQIPTQLNSITWTTWQHLCQWNIMPLDMVACSLFPLWTRNTDLVSCQRKCSWNRHMLKWIISRKKAVVCVVCNCWCYFLGGRGLGLFVSLRKFLVYNLQGELQISLEIYYYLSYFRYSRIFSSNRYASQKERKEKLIMPYPLSRLKPRTSLWTPQEMHIRDQAKVFGQPSQIPRQNHLQGRNQGSASYCCRGRTSINGRPKRGHLCDLRGTVTWRMWTYSIYFPSCFNSRIWGKRNHY